MIFKIDIRGNFPITPVSCTGTHQAVMPRSTVRWGPRSQTAELKDWIIRPCGPGERPVYSRPGLGPKINPFAL